MLRSIVAFGREVHDRARPVFGQQSIEQRAVADVQRRGPKTWRASPGQRSEAFEVGLA